MKEGTFALVIVNVGIVYVRVEEKHGFLFETVGQIGFHIGTIVQIEMILARIDVLLHHLPAQIDPVLSDFNAVHGFKSTRERLLARHIVTGIP